LPARSLLLWLLTPSEFLLLIKSYYKSMHARLLCSSTAGRCYMA